MPNFGMTATNLRPVLDGSRSTEILGATVFLGLSAKYAAIGWIVPQARKE